MKDVPVSLDRLWDWWRELARQELQLERQYQPLITQHEELHRRRAALENLMAACGKLEEVNRQIAVELEELRKGEQLPTVERRPIDAAYDILARTGGPMHYRDILTELSKAGIVIGGRDPGTALIVYLGRDRRFTKARESGRGFWKLTAEKP
ncbi:hypothetical protein ACFLW6_01455 [Chloroflexota bacterium]